MSDTVIQPRPAGHPLAGQRMTGARMIMQVLADEGVTAIFGYSGGAILPTYDAVFLYNRRRAAPARAQIPLIVPANEQGAGFMAAGYARASGRVGVCLVTSGPGATNTVTPVRDCMADSVPIVVISGQVSTAAIGTDAFQEAPVPSLMGSVAKHIFLVTDPTRLESTMRTAFEIARTGRPGPVVVDVPKDVQNWEGVFRGEGVLPIPGYRRRMQELAGATHRRLVRRALLRHAVRGAAAAHLRRRRGDQRQRRREPRRVRVQLRHPGGHDAHGHRRARHHEPAVAAHARHARRGLRQLRGR